MVRVIGSQVGSCVSVRGSKTWVRVRVPRGSSTRDGYRGARVIGFQRFKYCHCQLRERAKR